jgi:hypothetical protein
MRAAPDITNQKDWLVNETLVVTYVRTLNAHPLEVLLCERHQSINANETNYGNCWNDTYPNQAKHCPNSVPYSCISKYNVNDGIRDCARGKKFSIILIILYKN